MNCARCENIVNFSKPPFGAYFCKNEHIQCAECDFVSSYCAVCEDVTKYKSPHFIDEKTTDPKELERAKFQVPVIRDILPSKEDERNFQKLRYEITIGKPKFFLGLKKEADDISAVRTLSAIVTKNLYTANEDKNKADIDESSSYDLRLQRIIRTLREARIPANQNDFNAKTAEKKFIDNEKSTIGKSIQTKNLLTPTHSKLEATEKKCLSKIELKIETDIKSDEDDEKVDGNSTTSGKVPNGINFKSLFCPHLAQNELKGFPISIEATSLDRRPFRCPLGSCGCRIFISELNHHIVLDHPSMPLSQIKVGQFREFSIDIASCENSFAPQSVVCFVLKNIVVNFGSLPLKDVIPLFLMVGRYSLNDALDKPKTFSSDTHCVKPWSNKDYFLIWLAGVVPDRCEITASISVFSQDNSTLLRWYIDRVNSIQTIKDNDSIFNSSERLILTYPELKIFTNDFKDMLQCQVGIMGCELKIL